MTFQPVEMNPEVLRRIKNLVEQKQSYRKISEILKKDNVKTTRGGDFSEYIIRSIDEKYLGGIGRLRTPKKIVGKSMSVIPLTSAVAVAPKHPLDDAVDLAVSILSNKAIGVEVRIKAAMGILT